jgi:hypothetical protein
MGNDRGPGAGSGLPGGTDRQRYLSEVCGLLWPSPATVTLGGTAPSRGGLPGRPRGQEREFILLLGSSRPRLLIPAAAAPGAAAVRGYGEPGSARARLGARALSLAMASGIGGAVLRRRIRVSARAPTPSSRSPCGARRRRPGEPVPRSCRANRKPVLQLLSPQASTGFAKIGTSPLTRALVQAERDALIRLGRAGLSGVTVPEVLHFGEWRDLKVLVLSALPVRQRRRPVNGAALAAAMNSVACVGGLRREPLATGSYRRRLTGRLAAADRSAERDTLLGALDTLSARAGDAQLVLGSWHGDWTPWNMASTSDGLLVWDWERFTDGVPLGFDALHYRLQKDVVPGRREPRAAAAGCIQGAPLALGGFGLGAAEARITATLYLADLATRYLADRQAQAGALLGAPGAWLIPAITDHVRRL